MGDFPTAVTSLRKRAREHIEQGPIPSAYGASYNEIIRWLDDRDVTTRRILETILAVEEEHATDLLSLLEHVHMRS